MFPGVSDVEFVRPCNLCPHMKRNTLPKVLHSLEAMEYEITIAPESPNAHGAPSNACSITAASRATKARKHDGNARESTDMRRLSSAPESPDWWPH